MLLRCFPSWWFLMVVHLVRYPHILLHCDFSWWSSTCPSQDGDVGPEQLREQDGLRHCWPQAGTVRRDLEQDEEHDGQSRVQGGFRREQFALLPAAGWMGDNWLKKSDSMLWWKGCKFFVVTMEVHVDTLFDSLDKVCMVLSRPLSAPLRMPISGFCKIDVNSANYDFCLIAS